MPLISIIIPCFNESEVMLRLQHEMTKLTAAINDDDLEILLVDDGSQDDTWAQIISYAQSNHRVRAFQLSRNFGHQAAITCGYQEARGDAVVCLDADMQDPPEVVLDMLREWRAGSDIVLGKRISRDGETLFKLLTAKVFYRLLQLVADIRLTPDAGDFRLMSRRAVDAFNRLGERRRYIRGMVSWIGYNVSVVEYKRKPRIAGKTKFSPARMLAFATDGLLSFSFAPLRLAFGFAIIGSLPILIYLAYSFARHIYFHGHFEPGWASLMLTITIFSVLNLLCMGIVGEYVGRLYDEVKGRPLYLLSDVVETDPSESSLRLDDQALPGGDV